MGKEIELLEEKVDILKINSIVIIADLFRTSYSVLKYKITESLLKIKQNTGMMILKKVMVE